MSISVQEQYDSPLVQKGRQSRRYVVLSPDSSTYADIAAEVLSQQPATLDGLARQPVKITGNPAPGIWFAELEHIDPDSPDNDEERVENTFSFDTGGATTNVTVPLKNQSAHQASGQQVTDSEIPKAINVDKDGKPQGVDIVIPQFEFSVTKYFISSIVTLPYLSSLHEQTGTINNVAWKGFGPGSVLFKGASGQSSDDPSKPVPITFKFAASKNLTDFKVGDITVPSKDGWQYMWVKFETTTVNKELVTKPKLVFVADIYESTDFDQLGL